MRAILLALLLGGCATAPPLGFTLPTCAPTSVRDVGVVGAVAIPSRVSAHMSLAIALEAAGGLDGRATSLELERIGTDGEGHRYELGPAQRPHPTTLALELCPGDLVYADLSSD
jgi:hypothetical protein